MHNKIYDSKRPYTTKYFGYANIFHTRNSDKTMAQKLTRQRGMTRAQPQNLKTTTTGPTTCKVEEQQTNELATATVGPQLCKVESNKN